MGIFEKLFHVEHLDVFRASVRRRNSIRIIEVRAVDHDAAKQKIERRYGVASVEWIHRLAA